MELQKCADADFVDSCHIDDNFTADFPCCRNACSGSVGECHTEKSTEHAPRKLPDNELSAAKLRSFHRAFMSVVFNYLCSHMLCMYIHLLFCVGKKQMYNGNADAQPSQQQIALSCKAIKQCDTVNNSKLYLLLYLYNSYDSRKYHALNAVLFYLWMAVPHLFSCAFHCAFLHCIHFSCCPQAKNINRILSNDGIYYIVLCSCLFPAAFRGV